VAGVGAVATTIMVVAIYRCYRWNDLKEILLGVVRESSMIMMILAMSFIFTTVMSSLHISQSATAWLVGLDLSKWAALFWIDALLIVVGFFLPPAATVLMITPLLLPVLRALGFDLIWFGINMTIIMEMGLIHPPLGLNLFVIQGIAPDIPIKQLMWSTVPFLALSLLLITVMSVFPQIALWL
ncbi:MAG: TRAP transporter large permease subunit, partial [Candidimonas sp.]